MLQSAWYAQELLSTFDSEIASVTLQPRFHEKEGDSERENDFVSVYGSLFDTCCLSAMSFGFSPFGCLCLQFFVFLFANCLNSQQLVTLDGTLLWDASLQVETFPEVKKLKQLVRDKINPTKDLGHSDTTSATEQEDKSSAVAVEGAEAPMEMEDDDAADMRQYFGVM